MPTSIKSNPANGIDSVAELFEVVAALKDRDECEKFMQDLCTPMELSSMADRWQVAKLLAEGLPYRVIYEKTGVSTATITRVGRTLNHGAGGYRILLERAADKHDKKL